jgi:tyrosine-protein phosphatase YwqE
MTADTTRSNVLYLFQAEGAKELSVHIEESRAIRSQDSMLVQEVQEPTLTQEDQSSIPKKLKTQSLSTVVGTQILSIPVFNVI